MFTWVQDPAVTPLDSYIVGKKIKCSLYKQENMAWLKILSWDFSCVFLILFNSNFYAFFSSSNI